MFYVFQYPIALDPPNPSIKIHESVHASAKMLLNKILHIVSPDIFVVQRKSLEMI